MSTYGTQCQPHPVQLVVQFLPFVGKCVVIHESVHMYLLTTPIRGQICVLAKHAAGAQRNHLWVCVVPHSGTCTSHTGTRWHSTPK